MAGTQHSRAAGDMQFDDAPGTQGHRENGREQWDKM
jgi:hypothetical protein